MSLKKRSCVLIYVFFSLFYLVTMPLAGKSVKTLVKEGEFFNDLDEISNKALDRDKDMFILLGNPESAKGKAFDKEILVFPEFSRNVPPEEFVYGFFDPENEKLDLYRPGAADFARKHRVKEYPTVLLLDKYGMLYGKILFSGDYKTFWNDFEAARNNKTNILNAWEGNKKRGRTIFALTMVVGLLGVMLISSGTLYVLLDGDVKFLTLFAIVLADTLFRVFVPYGIWISSVAWLVVLVSRKGIVCFLGYMIVAGSVSYGFIKLSATGFVNLISYLCPPPV